MAMSLTVTSPFERFLRGIADLVRASNPQTRGHASFEVDDEGQFVHAYTVITEKMLAGEDIQAFHDRIRAKYQMRKGDTIDVLDNGGRLDTVRIKLIPRG